VFHHGIAAMLPQLAIDIVKRSAQVQAFVVLPKRWIIERTLGWLNRCRRLAKDWETSTAKRSLSCASLPSDSCSENFVILHELYGQTLSAP
jgi:transposase